MKRLIVCLAVIVFSLSVSNVLGQPCEGNFDCDQDVDGTDAAVFKEDFGRSQFSNPCPTCQENPCPCPEECPLSTCGFQDPLGPEACLIVGGTSNCCCCVTVGNFFGAGFCTDIETCFELPPHPVEGPYECIF